MFNSYPKILKSDDTYDDMPYKDVYNLIGGVPLSIYNGNPLRNRNACALRVSRALNHSGVNIPNIEDDTFRGADGKYYYMSAAKLYNFMKKHLVHRDQM